MCQGDFERSEVPCGSGRARVGWLGARSHASLLPFRAADDLSVEHLHYAMGTFRHAGVVCDDHEGHTSVVVE
jgi:hypothetical protein